MVGCALVLLISSSDMINFKNTPKKEESDMSKIVAEDKSKIKKLEAFKKLVFNVPYIATMWCLTSFFYIIGGIQYWATDYF